ncbi:MAG: hypothetical protein QXF82_10315 [Nitrososphaeria archaeon]
MMQVLKRPPEEVVTTFFLLKSESYLYNTLELICNLFLTIALRGVCSDTIR